MNTAAENPAESNSRPSLPVREAVLLVSGSFFFCESVALPDEVGGDSLAEFAELTLEGLSPFPPEQLYWGCLPLWAERRLLIFACLRGRLEDGGYANIREYRYVFPDFVGLFHLESQPAAPLLQLVSPVGWSAVAPGSGAQVAFGAFETEDAAAGADESGGKADADGSLSLSERVSRASIELPDSAEDLGLSRADARNGLTLSDAWAVPRDNAGVVFKYVAPGLDNAVFQASLSAADAWHADIREPSFKEARAGERRRATLLWKGLLAGIWASLLLLLLFLGQAGFGWWIDAREEQIAEQEPIVQQTMAQDTLVQRLERFSTDKMQPSLMLAIVNSVLPESLYLRRVEIPEAGIIRVSGIGDSSTTINAFARSLRELDYVEALELQIGNISAGKAPFDLLVRIPDPNRARATPAAVARSTQAAGSPSEYAEL